MLTLCALAAMSQTVGKEKKGTKHILCGVVLGDEVYGAATAKGSDPANIKEFCLDQLDSLFDGQVRTTPRADCPPPLPG